MFDNGLDKQLRSTLAIISSMSGLWLLGVIALTLVPTVAGSRHSDDSVNFRYQATGVTYAHQDVTGQFTVYIRGTQRIREHMDLSDLPLLADAGDPFASLLEAFLHYRWTPVVLGT